MVNTATSYYILSLQTTTQVMRAEAWLKNRLPVSIMPTPNEISKGCGLSIRFREDDLHTITSVLSEVPFPYKLYQLETRKINGKRPLTLLTVQC